MGISRENFCFTVGYNGEQAIVDKPEIGTVNYRWKVC